jgi:fatty-acyl-CoA synthase
MMDDFPLSIPAILRHTATLHGHKSIVSRRADRSLHRYTYADCLARAARLGAVLRRLGIRPGERVATFAWNHYRHIECYFGIPASGFVVHTLNIRLHPDDLAYIANHAEDRVVIVDAVLWPMFERFRDRIGAEHVIVMRDGGELPPGTLDYEALLDAERDAPIEFPDVDERSASGMCYTSGTTGRPKGVLYSHRSIVMHTFGTCMADGMGIRERDVVLPVVPMFHANAWGLPFTCAMVGASQVHPGPHLDPVSLLDLFQDERVTLSAGVPTIWMGVLQALDANPGRWDLSALRTMTVGGSAVPEALIRAMQERHGLSILQGWGMTETTPVASLGMVPSRLDDASADIVYAERAKAGYPLPFVEIRASNEDGFVPWDGQTMGELEVRGPWVASAYFRPDEDVSQKFTDDGWFRTGDVVTIDSLGCIVIQDRSKDLIKSGGEWISSVALENALMAHPSIAEAAVIAVQHPRWAERPLACVVVREGMQASPDELREFLGGQFAKWWIPDDVVCVSAIPRTSAGKFLKSALREQFAAHYQGAYGTVPGKATITA